MNYRKLNQEEQDEILKKELSSDIVKLIERYRLLSTPDLKWISKKENSHEQTIFTQSFLLKSDLIGALFRINYLCFAKLAYFRENIEKFIPLKYLPDYGFTETDLWDSDFLKHRKTGRIFDYRYFQRITDIEEFRALCDELEKLN